MSDSNYNQNAKVSIGKGKYEKLDINGLIKPLGGFNKFIENGDKVLIKTNLLNASTPEKTIVTNPIFIKNVIEELLKIKADPFIGDSPSGSFTKRRLEKVYSKSGMLDLSKELGIELNYNTKTQRVSIPEGKRLKKTSICNFALDADKIISLPKLKTHSLMIMTLAIKNMYGVIPGLTKARYHSMYIRKKAFAEMLNDLISVIKPDLSIIDGIISMEGDGPAGGNPIELGLMLASENPYALDLTVCDILDIEPVGIPVLKDAKIRKLIPNEISYPLLSPSQVKYKDFKLPSTSGHILTGKKIPNKYPIPNDNCTACGECVELCPKKIIEIEKKKALIDYSKCIRCYCCHEVCSYNAIDLDAKKID